MASLLKSMMHHTASNLSMVTYVVLKQHLIELCCIFIDGSSALISDSYIFVVRLRRQHPPGVCMSTMFNVTFDKNNSIV